MTEPRRPEIPDVGSTPHRDGQIATYVSGEAKGTKWFTPHRPSIFINGMANTGADHRKSALGLSLLRMGPVVGIYNASKGAPADLVECLEDKWQFHGPAAQTAEEALDRALERAAARPGPTPSRAQAMEKALARNPASLAVFRTLRKPEHRTTPVFAHSQGNLILSNALTAIRAVDGKAALKGREIRTFGSPAVNWPSPIRPLECGFTWDPVTWLSGFDFSFSISKVGMPGDSLNPITHSFAEYMSSDPAFVINRFRWGGFGVTFSMDEKGLAAALVRMGGNLPRVRTVFERLRDVHPSDADDVARLYVEALQRSGNGSVPLETVRGDAALCALLVDILESGWTSGRDRKAIDALTA